MSELGDRMLTTMAYIGKYASIATIRERGNISQNPMLCEQTMRKLQALGLTYAYGNEWGLTSWPKRKGENPVHQRQKIVSCKIDGCNRTPSRRGLCKRHYSGLIGTDSLPILRGTRKENDQPPDHVPCETSEQPGDREQPITTLEEIEQMVDEENGIDAAIDRLASTITHPLIVPDLANAATKVSMLRKFSELFEDSIAGECRELADWVSDVQMMDENVRALLAVDTEAVT